MKIGTEPSKNYFDSFKAPTISVVIPVWRGEETIGRCIAGIFASTYKPLEVIVVSDDSPDGSEEIARHLGAKVIQVSPKKGAAYCRNIGAANAAGEILIFVDVDVIVHSEAIENIVRHLITDEIDAVFGLYTADTPVDGVFTCFKNLQHHFVHLTNAGEAKTFWTGCGGVWRSSFQEAGGFDHTLQFMEDINLGHKLLEAGHRIQLASDVLCTHLRRYSFLSLIKSDLLGRAVPWTRLILSRRGYARTLNTTSRGIGGVVVTFCLLLSVVLSVWNWRIVIIASLLEAGMLYLNWGFLRYAARLKGLWFSLIALFLLHIYYINCGVGFIIGAMTVRRQR